MGIKKHTFRKECAFQYWEEDTESKDMVKELKEDLLGGGREVGDVLCGLMSHKVRRNQRICLRGICPFYKILKDTAADNKD